jgi:hypothetical protein
MTIQPIKAVIYVAGRVGKRREPECVSHCDREGYTLKALVRDDTVGVRFREVVAMMHRGEVDVVVTPSLSLLPPDRVPRIEPLDTYRSRGPSTPTPLRRRPRPIE